MRFPRRTLAVAIATAFTAFSLVSDAPSAFAHPQGNLTVNTATRIVLAPEQTMVTYILDLAELPTVQEQPVMEAAGDGYAADKCRGLSSRIGLSIGGQTARLVAQSGSAALLPGQGGLSTARVECSWSTAGIAVATDLMWTDSNFVDRLGWREVVIVGDGVIVDSELPTTSASELLTAYPDNVEAPRVLAGAATLRPGGPRLDSTQVASAAPTASDVQSRGADGLTQRFNRLVANRELTFGVATLAMAIAFMLGAFHALAPGHGKTLMAAMVVSRRGTPRQLVTIGSTVAVTHTAGVVILDLAITTSQAIAPDEVLPWLTILSGALLLATGGWILARRLAGRQLGTAHAHIGHGHGHGVFANHHSHLPDGHDHPHPDEPGDLPVHDHGHHDHDHGHHDHGHHGHGHGHHDFAHARRVRASDMPLRTRTLALIGMAGGMVPTPSALVVLLGATALGRAWFGVALVGVYGIGMASTLVAAGYALVRLQGWIELQYAEARWLNLGLRALPVMTALGLIVGGVSLAVRGAVSV